MPPYDPEQPFDLPPLPPRAELETRGVLKRCIAARAALAELKQAGDLIPNQAVLINTIPLLEAQASSAIENIVTTSDSLFRFAAEPTGTDPATKEAFRYGSALLAGYRSLETRPLSTSTAEQVCSVIVATDMAVRRIPGTTLVEQPAGRAIYTPPVGAAVLRDLLGNWEAFIHDERADLDPAIRLAVMHYQFEAIHPFTDGNGRTGRILNILFLIEKGLLTLPVLYLSRFVLAHRTAYYRNLQRVTETGEWEEWIVFMVEGLAETALWTTAKIRAIRQQMDLAVEHLRREVPAIYSRELVDILFSQPYVRIGNLVEAGLVKRQTASTYLRALVEAGMLRDIKAGRERLFLHPALIHLLTTESNERQPYARPLGP